MLKDRYKQIQGTTTGAYSSLNSTLSISPENENYNDQEEVDDVYSFYDNYAKFHGHNKIQRDNYLKYKRNQLKKRKKFFKNGILRGIFN